MNAANGCRWPVVALLAENHMSVDRITAIGAFGNTQAVPAGVLHFALPPGLAHVTREPSRSNHAAVLVAQTDAFRRPTGTIIETEGKAVIALKRMQSAGCIWRFLQRGIGMVAGAKADNRAVHDVAGKLLVALGRWPPWAEG